MTTPRTLSMKRQLEKLDSYRPHVVTGCPSFLELVAQALLDRSHAAVQPRLVVARGERLLGRARERLAAAFGCRVVDYYNVQEVGNVAWECPLDPDIMHINTDLCVLEVVDAAGQPLPPEEEGRIVVTNLYNLTMPFVRYALGDRGVMKSDEKTHCLCGARGPSMYPPVGREDEFIVLSDGSAISPRLIDDMVMDCLHWGNDPNFVPKPAEYRVFQELSGRLVVKLSAPEHVVRAVGQRLPPLVSALDRGLGCEVEGVEALEAHPSGKVRVVSSVLARKQNRCDGSC